MESLKLSISEMLTKINELMENDEFPIRGFSYIEHVRKKLEHLLVNK